MFSNSWNLTRPYAGKQAAGYKENGPNGVKVVRIQESVLLNRHNQAIFSLHLQAAKCFSRAFVILSQTKNFTLMKKSLSLLMAAFTAFAVDAYADKGFTTMQENTQGVAVSPNGRYLIGVNPTVKANGYMKSFIYDLSTDGLQWITEYDENDMTKGGEFVKVNDDGMVCGNAMDPDHMITYSDWAGTVVTPAMSAAVWKDGKRTLLGYGDFDLAELKNSGDGSFATGISADGKKVVGYFSTSSSAYVKSCVWTEDGGEWTLSWLPIPEDAKWSYAKAVSTDGSTIAGTVTMNDNTGNGIVWKDGGYTLITKDMLGVEDSWGQMKFNAMSPNGRYVVLTLSGNGTFVYDTEKGECKTIPLLDSEGSMGEVAIDNDGNAVSSLQFGSIFFGGDVYTIPFWYSYEEGRALAMDYYMSVVAEGVGPDFPMSAEDKTQVVPIAVSADGNVIVGNADTYVALGQTPKCWILEIEKDGLQIPATPGGLKAESNTLNHVRLTWDKPVSETRDLTYTVYYSLTDSIQTELARSILATNIHGNELFLPINEEEERGYSFSVTSSTRFRIESLPSRETYYYQSRYVK